MLGFLFLALLALVQSEDSGCNHTIATSRVVGSHQTVSSLSVARLRGILSLPLSLQPNEVAWLPWLPLSVLQPNKATHPLSLVATLPSIGCYLILELQCMQSCSGRMAWKRTSALASVHLSR